MKYLIHKVEKTDAIEAYYHDPYLVESVQYFTLYYAFFHCSDKIAHRVASGMMEPEATATCVFNVFIQCLIPDVSEANVRV